MSAVRQDLLVVLVINPSLTRVSWRAILHHKIPSQSNVMLYLVRIKFALSIFEEQAWEKFFQTEEVLNLM